MSDEPSTEKLVTYVIVRRDTGEEYSVVVREEVHPVRQYRVVVREADEVVRPPAQYRVVARDADERPMTPGPRALRSRTVWSRLVEPTDEEKDEA